MTATATADGIDGIAAHESTVPPCGSEGKSG